MSCWAPSPLVSVILPAYNAEPYLEASIKSILAQTHSNFELFVINDGSTDASLATMQRLATTDSRIKIVDNGNDAVVFYDLGATVADDPEVQEAFTGLSGFVTNFSIPMGEAAASATDYQDFIGEITTLFADPALQPLLTNASPWATTTHDFIVERCGI